MTESGPAGIVNLNPPIRCILWEHPERLGRGFADMLEEIETYEDSSHLTRSLYRCRECGQRYFHEWYEWVDWDEGNDRTYSTLLPVQTEEDIDALRQTNVFGLMRYFPRIQWDRGSPAWNGKD